MEFTVQELAPNFWAIDQKGVRSFLLAGMDNALLVDTCFGGDLLSVCQALTPHPITLITTHSDPDHIGSDKQFPRQYLHRKDFARYESWGKGTPKAQPLDGGECFSVGDYRLEVVWIPGHTPGSIALLDRKHRFLISGDTAQAGCIFMHGEGRNLYHFRDSIARLEEMRQQGLFDTLYPSHGEAVVDGDILPELLALAENVLSGTALPAAPAPDRFPENVRIYRHHRAQMFYAY